MIAAVVLAYYFLVMKPYDDKMKMASTPSQDILLIPNGEETYAKVSHEANSKDDINVKLDVADEGE